MLNKLIIPGNYGIWLYNDLLYENISDFMKLSSTSHILGKNVDERSFVKEVFVAKLFLKNKF